MVFPDKDQFLQAFGIEPMEEDPSLALCRYKVRSDERDLELLITFSAVQKTFELLLYCSGHEVINLVSERTTKIELYRDSSGDGVRACFDIDGAQAEAIVTLAPEIKCRWWLIRAE